MANDHYVQQGLMKFWSEPVDKYASWDDLVNGKVPWDGFVWCIDFVAKKLERVHTKKLFCIPDLHSPEVESRLGKLIEDQLSRFVKLAMKLRLRDDPQRIIPIETPEMLRAVSVAFHIQGARGQDGTRIGKDVLSRFLLATDEEIDQLGAEFRREHHILTFTMPDGVLLCLPETGWFPFPLADQKLPWCWAYAMPLNPRMALVAIPRGYTINDGAAGTLVSFSLGLQPGTRVVVPAEELRRDHSELVETLSMGRDFAMTVSGLVQSARPLGAADGALAGLPRRA